MAYGWTSGRPAIGLRSPAKLCRSGGLLSRAKTRWSRFNINGKHVKQKGYITDELPDYTLQWLADERDTSQPFFVYLSHKAVHANFKLIQYHGIWDTDELYDIKNDPQEMHNLIDDRRYLNVKLELRKALYQRLEEGGEHSVPYTKQFSTGAVFRQGDRSKAAEFPDNWLRKGDEKDLEKSFIYEKRVK